MSSARPRGRAPGIDLPDVNVWLAASVDAHPFHQRALRWWAEEAAAEIAFCRITALALVRLLTQPAVMAGQPLPVAAAWQHYGALRALEDVILLREPETAEKLLAEWALAPGAKARVWTDSYLACCARAGACRLVTFDPDFEQFDDLELMVLRP